MPLTRMTGIVGRLAKQDYAVEILPDRRRDEIGEMNEAIEIFRANGIEKERLDAERQADQRTKDLILEMMHRLQACQNQIELAGVVARLAPEIFPDLSGGLYILNESRTTLIGAALWRQPKHAEDSFPASLCWGLRRGRPHMSGVHDTDVPCQHLDGADVSALCVPLTAQGEMIGLLYLERNAEGITDLTSSRLYLELIAENLGLAIANLQLREKLTEFAIRDAHRSVQPPPPGGDASNAPSGLSQGTHCMSHDRHRSFQALQRSVWSRCRGHGHALCGADIT